MDETQEIVEPSQLYVARKPSRPAHPWLEVILCVVGSLGSLYFPALGVLAMVYGAWLLARKEERRMWWGIAGCLVPAIILCFVSWGYYGSLVLPCALCALVIALLLPGHVTITNVCLLIVGLTAAMILADASLVVMDGESISAYVDELLEELYELMGETFESVSDSATSALGESFNIFEAIWPLIYVIRAVIVALLGLFGLMLARRDTFQRVYQAYLHYDLPLWAIVVLIIGFVGLICQLLGAAGGEVLGAIGLDLLFCMRPLLFLQGLAMFACLMDRHRWRSVARVLILILSLLGEAYFAVTSLIGIVDIWADFRSLRHERRQRNEETNDDE